MAAPWGSWTSLALGMVQHEGEVCYMLPGGWLAQTGYYGAAVIRKHPVLLAWVGGYLYPIPGGIHGWGFSAMWPMMPPSMAGTLNIPSIYFP